MPKRIGQLRGPATPPITRAEIEHAQANTKSNMEAARFLNVGYERYKRYAKIYNLFDSHLNPTGIGVNKGYAARPSSVPLKDVFANKHPTYSIVRLKNRMIARNIIAEECSMCGFKEKRITDSKTPLMLTFKNGTRDFTQSNLELLCYNCLFLTTGAPSVANRGYIKKSFNAPDEIPKRWDVAPRPADSIDVGEEDDTSESFDDIKDQILKELGRD
jgi:hypothetical protein